MQRSVSPSETCDNGDWKCYENLSSQATEKRPNAAILHRGWIVCLTLGSFIGSNFWAVHLTFIGHHRASLLPATGPGSSFSCLPRDLFLKASWFLPTKPVPHKGAACCSGNCRRNLKLLGRMVSWWVGHLKDIGKLATWLQLWSPRVGLRPSFKCCRLPSVKLPYVGLLPL